MKNRADEIRKRINQRKKVSNRIKKTNEEDVFWVEDEERYGFEKISSYEGGAEEGSHPLFSKDWILFKILASACLFLAIAILFKNETASFESARNFVKTTMEKDFQFIAVSNWYEEKFGKPLSLLPPLTDEKKDEKNNTIPKLEYALPASARILEDFQENGKRITIETDKDEAVEAMGEGLVRFAGKKEDFGKTVIIKHADNSESWYGNLAEINVNLMEYIETGSKIGTSTVMEDGLKGSFYFAIKKGDDFVDPSQVIPFE